MSVTQGGAIHGGLRLQGGHSLKWSMCELAQNCPCGPGSPASSQESNLGKVTMSGRGVKEGNWRQPQSVLAGRSLLQPRVLPCRLSSPHRGRVAVTSEWSPWAPALILHWLHVGRLAGSFSLLCLSVPFCKTGLKGTGLLIGLSRWWAGGVAWHSAVLQGLALVIVSPRSCPSLSALASVCAEGGIRNTER